MAEIEYITDSKGQLKGVLVPVEIWKEIFPESPESLEELLERFEDYCLNKAMDEAKESPLLTKDEAISFLNES